MTLNCIHIFIVTGGFLYWCVMRLANQRFFINSCIYLRILIISYLATFLGTNSLSVLMCRNAVNQSILLFIVDLLEQCFFYCWLLCYFWDVWWMIQVVRLVFSHSITGWKERRKILSTCSLFIQWLRSKLVAKMFFLYYSFYIYFNLKSMLNWLRYRYSL